MARATVTGRIEIEADADLVYELVSDPGVLAELAEEYAGHEWLDGASSARVGARFRGRNRRGLRRWSTVATVTDADRGARFAFEVRVLGCVRVSRWQYEIESAGDGCRVVESSWDHRPGWFRPLSELATGVFNRPEENRRNIEKTLLSLRRRAERDSPAV